MPSPAAPTFTGFTRGYTSSRINLTSLAGQAVRFRFRIGTDGDVGFQGWFIDDIRVYRCVAGSSAPTANAGAGQDGGPQHCLHPERVGHRSRGQAARLALGAAQRAAGHHPGSPRAGTRS